MTIFLTIVAAVLITALLLALVNHHLPIWFCDHMGWHFPGNTQGFDGCSFTSTCARCGKKILQDSQGNWFEA